jgi:hypothetical protein
VHAAVRLDVAAGALAIRDFVISDPIVVGEARH